MTRKIILQRAEVGVKETLAWKTAITTSVTNAENRVAVRSYPDEQYSYDIRMNEEASVEFIEGYSSEEGQYWVTFGEFIESKDEITIPIWHQSSGLLSQSWQSATSVLNATVIGNNLRIADGEQIIARAGQTWFLGTAFLTLPGNSIVIVFPANTGKNAVDFVEVVPLRDGLVSSSSVGTESFYGPKVVKFDVDLSRGVYRTQYEPKPTYIGTYASLPTLSKRPANDGKMPTLKQGTQRIETVSGFPAYRTLWVEPQVEFDLTFEFDRQTTDDLHFWRSFINRVKGSEGSFWYPMWNLYLRAIEAYGSSGFYCEGIGYASFWEKTTFKRVCVTTNTGANYFATVTGVDIVSGRTLCALDIIIPAGQTITAVCVAANVRVSDDQFSFMHEGWRSTLSFRVTGVRNDALPNGLVEPTVNLYGTNPNATVSGGAFTIIPADMSVGGNFAGGVSPPVFYWFGSESFDLSGGQYKDYDSSAANFSFLNYNGAFTIALRFQFVSASASEGIIFRAGTPTKFSISIVQVAGQNKIRMTRGSRVTTSTTNLTPGQRYTIFFRCPGTILDELYVTNTLDAIGLGSIPEITMVSPVRLGDAGAASARSIVGALIMFPQALSGAQRDFVKTELETIWPNTADTTSLLVDTSLSVVSGLVVVSCPVSGSEAGADMLFSGSPVQTPVNGLMGLYAPTASDYGTFQQALSVWTKYFNNSVSWSATFAVQFGASPGTTQSVIEVQSASAGLLIGFDATTLFVKFTGPSGTVTKSTPFTTKAGVNTIVCVKFVTGATPTIQFIVNGVASAAQSITGFTFASANSTGPAYYGKGAGWSALETRMSLASEDFTEELRAKWFPELWASLVSDTSDYLISTTDDNLVEM